MLIPFAERKIVALDIGGVCISLHFDQCLAALGLHSQNEIPPEFLAACEKLETGIISEQEWLDVFSLSANGRFSRAELMEAWNRIIGPDLPGMADAVSSLSERYRFVYFSNTSRFHLDEVVRRNGFGHLVTGGIYSFEAQSMKPNSKMYEAFEARYGKPFAYFDDRADNVAGGKSRGWNAYVFRSSSEFLDILSK